MLILKIFKLLSLLISFHSIVLVAQLKDQYFLKTDFGLSSMRIRPAGAMGPRFGYALGLELLRRDESSTVLLNPSFCYVKTGYSIYVANDANQKVIVRYFRLDMPILYDATPGEVNQKIFLGGGPFLATAVGGYYTDPSGRKKLHFGNGGSANRKILDGGVVLKVAATNVSPLKANIGLQYDFGLFNLIPSKIRTGLSAVRSRNVYLSISFPIFFERGF